MTTFRQIVRRISGPVLEPAVDLASRYLLGAPGAAADVTAEPGLFMKADGTVWLRNPDSTETQIGSGGSQAVYVQDEDPGAVGAGKLWITVTDDPPVAKIRNTADDDWTPAIMKQGGPLDADLEAGGNKITNLGDVDFDGGSVTVSYSDLDMAGNKVRNVDDPASDQDAATKAYVDGLVSPVGIAAVLAVDNDAGTYNIANLADPFADQDAATKKYVDDRISPPDVGVRTARMGGRSGSDDGTIDGDWGEGLPLSYTSGAAWIFAGWDDWGTAGDGVLASDGALKAVLQEGGTYRITANVWSSQVAVAETDRMLEMTVGRGPGTTIGYAIASHRTPVNQPTGLTVTTLVRCDAGDFVSIDYEDEGIGANGNPEIRYALEIERLSAE